MGQQADLFDCRYRSVYEVYTYLAANTTVRPTVPELVERGWIPLIQAGLVGISTSGYLVWTASSTGERKTLDTDVKTAVTYGLESAPPLTFLAPTTPSGDYAFLRRLRRLAFVTLTVAGGAGLATAQTICTGAGGTYYPIAICKTVFSSGSEAAVRFLFKEGANAVTSLPSGQTTQAFTANVVNNNLNGVVIKKGTAGAAGLTVEIDNGGGADGLLYYLLFEWWQEY